MGIKEWSLLNCQCGSSEFTATHELSWKDGQGSVPKQKGYVCAGCGRKTNIAALTNHAKDIALQKKIEELKEQRESL